MKHSKLSTQPYKGVRDFYPDDMAVQQYLFDTWSYTAEQFGFVRYDASILEPSALYRSKGAVNEEMVNDQTYTFTDRGDREVTLRPEMTPTVARMVAGKRNELRFPVRWYSIPNLFRYERTQRGRLREHWQLNCDIFGVDDAAAEVEILLLTDAIFKNFGAENGVHYAIEVSSRRLLNTLYEQLGLEDETALAVTRLADRKLKMSAEDFHSELTAVADKDTDAIIAFLEASTVSELAPALQTTPAAEELATVVEALAASDCTVRFNPTIVRGFDYYTGIVFEVTDLHPENNRSMMGGGRYDNLTTLFGGEPISGIGFGFGDVTLRDFLESHDLLQVSKPAPTLAILPQEADLNITCQEIAQQFRTAGISVSVDMSTKKIGKKISQADEQHIEYVIVIGADEAAAHSYTLKKLTDGTGTTGTIAELTTHLE